MAQVTRDNTASRAVSAAADSAASRRYFLVIAVVVCLLSLIIFFREFFSSGFNLIAGDVGDNRFLIAILEHWRAVIHGQASFTSPNFFWPERGVLGYSDALFLFFPLYIAGHATGLDIYLAFELTLILVKALGFLSMLWLLRSFVGVSRSAAVIGSALFTISNLYYISVNHAQLMTVAFVPLAACLACAAWGRYGRAQKKIAHAYAALFGLLLALVLFTSFYIGWFAMVAACMALGVALLTRIIQERKLSAVRQWTRAGISRWPILAVAALVFSVAIIPFLVTYLPALRQTGGRSFQGNLSYCAHVIDLIDVGQSNRIWGGLINKAAVRLTHGPIAPGELQTGWPPFTLVLVAAGGLLTLKRKSAGYYQPFLATVLVLSFFVCWLLSLSIDGCTLWWFVFKFIPGAAAIRVPARFNLVLNVFAVMVVCIVLNEIAKRGGRAWGIVFWTASLFLLAEQTNTAATHTIRRNEENAILRRVGRPPATCSSFYLSHAAAPERPFYANQIDAILLARKYNLPTINGAGGWMPPYWGLLLFDSRYPQEVRQWVLSRHIAAGFCGLDLRDGSWRMALLK